MRGLRLGTALLGSLLATLAVSPGPATAAQPIPVKATLTGSFHPAVHGVTCPVDERGVCGVKYSGDGTIVGDLEGIVQFWGTEWLTVDRPTYSNEMIFFAGTVKGCGQGTVTYFANPVDDGGVDLEAGGYRGSETWQILPGYGSSGLASLTGSGVSPWVLRPDNTVIAEYEGTITCDAPRASRASTRSGKSRRSARRRASRH